MPRRAFSALIAASRRVLAAALFVLAAALFWGHFRHASGEPEGEDEVLVLIAHIEQHIRNVHAEIQALFDYMCDPAREEQIIIPSPYEQTPGDINLPACSNLADHQGLYKYYGNINMLMVEAWRGKILPALRHQAGALKVQSALLTVEADGDVGGAIFVQQLLAGGAPARAALMIGIHRMPRHKLMLSTRQPTRRPAVTMTAAVIERVIAWASSHDFTTLFVCPYDELIGRLPAHGFVQVADPTDAQYAFGPLDLRRDVCEESALHALRLEPGIPRGGTGREG